jgi:hypothetical protein
MRFVITGEMNRNRLLQTIVVLYSLYVAGLWVTNTLLYFDKMSLYPSSVVAYYLGDEGRFMAARSAQALLEISHFHLFAMGMLLLVLTHLMLFVPREALLDPRKDGSMGLEIDEPSRARNRRVIRRRFIQREVQKLANRERVPGAPGDAALRIDALEVADQQQPKVHAGRQARAPHGLGVKRAARPFNELVELLLVEQGVQASIKWMRGRRRQIGGGDPEIMLTPSLASGAHRHRRQCSTRDRSCRSLLSASATLTTGC